MLDAELRELSNARAQLRVSRRVSAAEKRDRVRRLRRRDRKPHLGLPRIGRGRDAPYAVDELVTLEQRHLRRVGIDQSAKRGDCGRLDLLDLEAGFKLALLFFRPAHFSYELDRLAAPVERDVATLALAEAAGMREADTAQRRVDNFRASTGRVRRNRRLYRNPLSSSSRLHASIKSSGYAPSQLCRDSGHSTRMIGITVWRNWFDGRSQQG